MSGAGDLPTGLGPSLSNRHLAAGDILFAQGEPSDRAYILADGRNQLDGPARALLEDPAVADIYLGGRARGSA